MKDMPFLSGAGAMAEPFARCDWNASPVGPPSQWSPALKAMLGMLLPAKAEIILFWGPEYVAFYNEAYTPTIGVKHPRALGRPARENWSELWDDLESLLRGVRETGETLSAKDRPFYIERHGIGGGRRFEAGGRQSRKEEQQRYASQMTQGEIGRRVRGGSSGVLPAVDEEAVETAQRDQQSGRKEHGNPQRRLPRDGGYERGGREEEPNRQLLRQAR